MRCWYTSVLQNGQEKEERAYRSRGRWAWSERRTFPVGNTSESCNRRSLNAMRRSMEALPSQLSLVKYPYKCGPEPPAAAVDLAGVEPASAACKAMPHPHAQARRSYFCSGGSPGSRTRISSLRRWRLPVGRATRGACGDRTRIPRLPASCPPVGRTPRSGPAANRTLSLGFGIRSVTMTSDPCDRSCVGGPAMLPSLVAG